jgi:hypothetical protein
MMREIAASKTGNFRGVCPNRIRAAEDFLCATACISLWLCGVGRLKELAFLIARSDTPGKADKSESQSKHDSAHVQQYEK